MKYSFNCAASDDNFSGLSFPKRFHTSWHGSTSGEIMKSARFRYGSQNFSTSITSTTVEALDGSVIAFQNSQLFAKNYKNLTRNHGNLLSIIPIGVAYGTSVPQVKQIVNEVVTPLNKPGYIKYIKVTLAGFGDNSVDFKILAWVDSRKQSDAEGEIMEAVYNAFNDHNIEIPFPQRDIHIVSDTAHLVPPSPTSPIQHADSLEEAEEQLRNDTKD